MLKGFSLIFRAICLPCLLGEIFFLHKHFLNANPHRGYKDKKSYDLFVTEYEQFIANNQVEGYKTSASGSRVGSRTPLQLALMISPLYLLVTFRLSTKSFNRRTVIDLAAKLGPHKPPLVLAVEKLIWDALFKLADAPPTAYGVLRDLANSLPWSEINDVLNGDAEQWFSLTPCMLRSFYFGKS